MEGSFNKAKKRAFKLSLAGGVLCGAGVGLAVTGIFLLSFKLAAVELGWYVYLLIGIFAAALSGAVAFFVIRPDDKKLAKKLDEDYALGEKAQTLIEFAGQDSDVLSLQREDAEAAIAAIKYKKPSAKRVTIFATVALLCCALFVSGAAVKQRYPEKITPIDEQPFIISDSQLVLFNLLVTNVSGETSLDGTLKTQYSEILSDLYDYVTDESATNGGMETEVKSAMLEISVCTFTVNTYDNFISAFDSVDNGRDFALAFYNSATVYKSAANVDSYDTVLSKASGLADSVAEIFDELVESVVAVTGATEFATDFGSTLQKYMDIFSGAMNYETVNSDDFPEDDGLYSAVQTLNTDLLSYYTSYINSQGYSIDWYHNNIEASFNTFSQRVSNIMYQQTYNCLVDEYVRQSLADIFGVEIQGLENPEVSSQSSEEGDDNSASQGGAGSGGTVYGSDDYIYNPATNEYVSYGEMLSAETNGYLSKLYAMLSSEDISDEVKSYIRTYINKLLGTSGE